MLANNSRDPSVSWSLRIQGEIFKFLNLLDFSQILFSQGSMKYVWLSKTICFGNIQKWNQTFLQFSFFAVKEGNMDFRIVSDRISVSVYGIGRNRKYRYRYRSRNFFYRNRNFFFFFKKFQKFSCISAS